MWDEISSVLAHLQLAVMGVPPRREPLAHAGASPCTGIACGIECLEAVIAEEGSYSSGFDCWLTSRWAGAHLARLEAEHICTEALCLSQLEANLSVGVQAKSQRGLRWHCLIYALQHLQAPNKVFSQLCIDCA